MWLTKYNVYGEKRVNQIEMKKRETLAVKCYSNLISSKQKQVLFIWFLSHCLINASLTGFITPAWFLFCAFFYQCPSYMNLVPTPVCRVSENADIGQVTTTCLRRQRYFSTLSSQSFPQLLMSSAWHAGWWSVSSQELHWWKLWVLLVCKLSHSMLSSSLFSCSVTCRFCFCFSVSSGHH